MKLPSFVTLKFLGFLTGGLGLALIAASAFGWVQTERLTAAREFAKAQAERIGLLEERVASDGALIAQRDVLIGKQNDAVKQLVAASQESRKAYLARIEIADRSAQTYRAQAKDILAATTEAKTELERSRAALQLIHDTIAAPAPAAVDGNVLRDPRKE